MRKLLNARRGLILFLLAITGLAAVAAPVLVETRNGAVSDMMLFLPLIGAAGWLAFLARFSRGFFSATALILAGAAIYGACVIAAAGLSMTLFA